MANISSVFSNGVDALKDFFAGLVDDFKESSRQFKIKLSIIGGYLLIVVLTLIVFIPPGELNEIDASIRIAKTEIIGGRYFRVENRSSLAWKSIVLTLNSDFAYHWPRLRPGKHKAFYFKDFKGSGGGAPKEEIRIRRLRIDCDQGSFERRFGKD